MELSLPILYSFKRCPYAIRARMALGFARIDHIHREINLKDKHPLFLQVSPKGTVPVLEIKNKQLVIDESYDIVKYALEQNLPKNWSSNAVLKKKDSQALYQNLCNSAIPAIRKIKYAENTKEICQSTILAINNYLETINALLKSQHYLQQEPSALDILIFPNLRQLMIHDPDWLKRYRFDNVDRWMNTWTQHPLFKKIFITQPVWEESQAPIIINHEEH